MNCYSVTFQLKQDRNIYEFSYRDEWIEALTEIDAIELIKKQYGVELVEIKRVNLTGSWAEFQADLKRSFQGD